MFAHPFNKAELQPTLEQLDQGRPACEEEDDFWWVVPEANQDYTAFGEAWNNVKNMIIKDF